MAPSDRRLENNERCGNCISFNAVARNLDFLSRICIYVMSASTPAVQSKSNVIPVVPLDLLKL